jgi:cyclase
VASASVQKIGADLYAYISQNDASANSTFLVGDKGILVVDTGLDAKEGGRLLEEIRKISPLPILWIVNTHYHPDHRVGNNALAPDALVISTAYTRNQVLRGAKRQAGAKLPTEYVLNANFEKEVSLFIGNHEVRIYHPGLAHTLGDLIVYFPDEHAISTGDLFLNNSCPAMDEGSIENWIKALERILALPVEHVVPGHFDVGKLSDVQHFHDYLADLRDQVAAMYRRGFTLAQVKRGLKMEKYQDLRQFPKYEATFTDNAAAYYHQLQHPSEIPKR